MGYGARLPHDDILSKFQPYVTNNALNNKMCFIRDVLCSIGCQANAYVLKETKVVFRPKTADLVNILLNLNDDDAKTIAKKVYDKFIIRKRNVLRIFLRCVGLSNYQCTVYPINLKI